MKTLYVPTFLGELGWELLNYVPHVNHVFAKGKGKYERVIVSVRPGRQGIYPMGTEFIETALPDAKCCGNAGYNSPKIEKARIHELKKAVSDLTIVNVKGIAALKLGVTKKRRFLAYKATAEARDRWANTKGGVVLCVRGRKHGPYKNWSPANWNNLCLYILKRGHIPILTGTLERVKIAKFPKGAINLMGQTNLEDMIAIMCNAKCAIGQSTGTLHLASLCRTPHGAWGPTRIKERYKRAWNPLKTIAAYESCGARFDCSPQRAKRLFDKLLGRL